jgi:hypothetical protein
LKNIKSFVSAIKDLTEVHIFGWNGAIKHNGGYYGSDITIFNYLHEILTPQPLPRKKYTFITIQILKTQQMVLIVVFGKIINTSKIIM